MLKILKVFVEKVWRLITLKKPIIGSPEQVHWVNHIYDETTTWPNKALMWANVHGFEEGGEGNWTYWLGVDIRSFGIRCADYVIKFKSRALYEEFRDCAANQTEGFLTKMRTDGRLNCRRGSDVGIEFVFKWGGEEKTFDVRLSTDDYAEER